MAATSANQVNSRVVVLLKPGDKQRLQELAREENVSSSEIVRRSLHRYGSESAQQEIEETQIRAALAEMSGQLDKALSTIRSARLEVAENIANIRKIRAQHA